MSTARPPVVVLFDRAPRSLVPGPGRRPQQSCSTALREVPARVLPGIDATVLGLRGLDTRWYTRTAVPDTHGAPGGRLSPAAPGAAPA